MFEGVYCKEKDSNTVSESILIDSFINCIDSALNPQSCENLSESAEMSTASNHNSDLKNSSNNVQKPLSSCVAGQNVRAIYSADGKLYEAVVKRLFNKPPNIMAIVRYHGYGNEESVNVKSIFPSLGPIAIKQQIECAKLEETSDVQQTGSDGNVQKEINWKKGMACRALYDKKDTIYEGTVLEVNDRERTADVEMLGYGTRFQAKFENMYESLPELREKQASSAQKYINEEILKYKIPNCGDQPSLDSLTACSSSTDERDSSTDLKKVDVSDPPKEPKHSNKGSVKWSVPLVQSQSFESLSEREIYPKETVSNGIDLETKVVSDISKESKLESTNENVQSSETLASDGAVSKENKSNNLDFDAGVDVKPKLDCINEKVPSSEILAAGGAHFKTNPPNSADFETMDDVDASNEPKLNHTASELTDVLTENHLPLSLRRSDGIMQPESEPEALACLLSANYLSGYYAGYYDCIRKRQNVENSES